MRFRAKTIRHVVELPAPVSDRASVFAFSLAKAGSTLLFDILARLSKRVGLIYFSVEDRLFAENVSPTRRPNDIGSPFRAAGFCYGGFRQFPAFPVPILQDCRSVLLVRDPRDMIVSLYFSLLCSHVIPTASAEGTAREEMLAARSRLEGVDVNRYALEAANNYTRMFEGYVAQGFHWRPNVAIYRYEDVISRKEEWLADLCGWFEWDVDAMRRKAIASKLDAAVSEERPDRHIRQVAPGNYRRHLQPQTVAHIESTLGEYMRLFGYL